MTQRPFQIQRVLFPTDFSNSSQAIAPHVAGVAQAAGAGVFLLHVSPQLAEWQGASERYFSVSDDVLRQIRLGERAAEESSLKMLEQIKKDYFSGLKCESRVQVGGVAKTIVEYADEIHADLIMMPTRGSGPLRPFLIGSTTAKVLHDARCAVWTSPHPKELGAFRPYRQIVCAQDYRRLSRGLLVNASEIAQLFHSGLSVVSSVPDAGGQSVSSLKESTQAALQHLLDTSGVNVPFRVLEGSVGEAIQKAVAMDDADLVVIGRGSLDHPLGHLRTHAYEIIWDSPCPVLSL